MGIVGCGLELWPGEFNPARYQPISQGGSVSASQGPGRGAVPLSSSWVPALVAGMAKRPVSEPGTATGSLGHGDSASGRQLCAHVGFVCVSDAGKKGRCPGQPGFGCSRPFLLPWMVTQPVDSGWGQVNAVLL